jgi:AcrR family transcriptional regulator
MTRHTIPPGETDDTIPRRGRTRNDILEAAHRVFMERGFHAASMRQIAQEAGIALGGIYNHFNSKEDIFTAVFLERHPYLDVLPLFNDAQGDSIDEVIRDAAHRLVSSLEQRTDFLNLMFIELVEFNGQHIPEMFQAVFPQVMAFARRHLANRPELRPLPLVVVIRAFIGLFFSYLITDILIADQLPPEGRQNALDHFVDIYLHGILKQAAPVEEVR